MWSPLPPKTIMPLILGTSARSVTQLVSMIQMTLSHKKLLSELLMSATLKAKIPWPFALRLSKSRGQMSSTVKAPNEEIRTHVRKRKE